MEATIGSKLHNKFDIQLINKDGNVTQSVTAYNVVLNRYYTDLNSNTAMFFNRLYLGTGTGTPTVTDTGLFSHLTDKGFELSQTDVHYLGVNQYSMSKSLTFSEAEAIGQISEIGIGTYNNVVYTHAMVTDAEGHVISINKTDTDRLIITITVYLTLTRPSNVVPVHNITTTVFSVYGETPTSAASITAGDGLEMIVRACMGLGASIADGDIYCSLSPGEIVGVSSDGDGVAISTSVTVTDNVIRKQSSGRILSSQHNLPGTYQIYGFFTPIGYLPITNSVFPALPITLTRTADGTQKAFNFGIAELMSDVKVYINDVLQPANSYTWNGKDYSIFQAWETCHADYVIKTPVCLDNRGNYYAYMNVNYTSPIFNNYKRFDNRTWDYTDLVYDFKTALTFTRAYKPSATAAYNDWTYSNDNINWTTIEIPASPDTNYYDFPTPITARYLRMQTGVVGGNWLNSCWTPSLPELCCYKDQLVFNTAPAANSIVKIEAKSAYPIKNSNWILDQFVLDMQVSRA